MKFRNLISALQDQGPFIRFLRNFFWTGNAWGLFSKYSHITKQGKPKVSYNTKVTALKAAKSMQIRNGGYYSTYKCIYCNGFHIGRNRLNKSEPVV